MQSDRNFRFVLKAVLWKSIVPSVFLVCSSLAVAGKFNPVLSVGDAAPQWKALMGVDGKQHDFGEFKSKPVLVVVFLANTCPIGTGNENYLIALQKKYQKSKVQFVAICVSTAEGNKLSALKKRTKQKKFNFPYLSDPSQKLGTAYGHYVTPQVFVLNQKRIITYMGSITDQKNPAEAKTFFLEKAITASLAKQKPKTTETRPFGCQVVYDESSDD